MTESGASEMAARARALALKHYLALMVLQVLTLLVWWPKQSLATVLTGHGAPGALLALFYAVAFTSSFASMRAGAGEFRLAAMRTESQPGASLPPAPAARLRDATALCAWCALQLLLALPLIVIATAVTPLDALGVVLNCTAIVMLSISATALGRLSWILLWRYETVHYLICRLLWSLLLLLPALLLPDTSYVIQSYLQYSALDAPAPASDAGHADMLALLAWQMAFTAAVVALARYLAPARKPGAAS